MPFVLVTGGAGYIGSHICKQLSGAGFTPVSFDIASDHAWAVKWGPAFWGDITQSETLAHVKSAYSPVAVVHCAALIDAAESVREPQRYWCINVCGTRAIAQAFPDVPIVFSSSAAVYGEQDQDISERNGCAPVNPYGKSKLVAEQILRHAICLRYFNVAGADGEVGESHDPETHVIPRALISARDGSEFEIQGDGSAQRDFVHVNDVAAANVMAVKALLAGAMPVTLNICGGNGASVLSVVKLASKVTGQKIKSRRQPRRDGDTWRLVGDNTRAGDLLGWYPAYDLTAQITSAWHWMKR